MELDIIVDRVLYTVSIDVSWNIWNKDTKSWVTDMDVFTKVKKYTQDYFKHLSQYD